MSLLRLPPYWCLSAHSLEFPPPELTAPDGVLAIGGDLSTHRLLAAYRLGIFPWYSEGSPILWHCPNPRFVLEPHALHVPKSLKKYLRHPPFSFCMDTCFPQVVHACASTPRPGQNSTWLTQEMQEAYVALHHLGFAHSVETFLEGALVGGLYGVCLGNVFFGESMFATSPNASKLAFVLLVQTLLSLGVSLVDCQQKTPHLQRFGAVSWPRKRFLSRLQELLSAPTRKGSWAGLFGAGTPLPQQTHVDA
ncbi:MAG: leucyl/phenylalanyl-tRNA--protein transferase [Proteobacteria bacterium]|nr:leucyl/phenylalanyl-tRNA--protein transferase [Cystobacterineae bacterium]MCL2259348.1 leucyl/phenylalanyl-tRNA--protein transferase [Cystobacterineae bacterium]MCL2314085.1 leucyl/phenylalanyl-tRNA--protein transferase [Pseudomonadota bacterium]